MERKEYLQNLETFLFKVEKKRKTLQMMKLIKLKQIQILQ